MVWQSAYYIDRSTESSPISESLPWNRDTSRRKTDATRCCLITSIVSGHGSSNTHPSSRRMNGILCSWKLCKEKAISNICWRVLLYGTADEKKALVTEQRKEVLNLEQRFTERPEGHDRGGSQKKSGFDRSRCYPKQHPKLSDRVSERPESARSDPIQHPDGAHRYCEAPLVEQADSDLERYGFKLPDALSGRSVHADQRKENPEGNLHCR